MQNRKHSVTIEPISMSDQYLFNIDGKVFTVNKDSAFYLKDAVDSSEEKERKILELQKQLALTRIELQRYTIVDN
jgi:hypothetical protein